MEQLLVVMKVEMLVDQLVSMTAGSMENRMVVCLVQNLADEKVETMVDLLGNQLVEGSV